MLSASLAIVLSIGMASQVATDTAAPIASLVGDEVAVVLHVDLTRLDLEKTAKALVSDPALSKELAPALQMGTGQLGALKQAGAKDAFVLIDLFDMPGIPVFVVTIAPGGNAAKLRDHVQSLLPPGGADPVVVQVRDNLVIACSARSTAKLKAPSTPRPELAAALAAAGTSTAQVVFIPSNTQRRAVEEAMPNLPPQLGGGPITTLTREASWAELSLITDPAPALRLIVQASNSTGAKALEGMVARAREFGLAIARKDPTLAQVVPSLEKITPHIENDRIVLDLDSKLLGELVLPPILAAREAARRSQSTNNLKQIGLAMHNYLDKHDGRFVAPYSSDRAGKPLLSWRVQILPYLEQEQLYREFHLDEPWDSDHNRPLIARMPAVYSCPSGDPGLPAQGKTTYVVPRGKGTLFGDAEGVKLSQIIDGTSNTVLAVETSDSQAVVWTKPDDWEVTDHSTIADLASHHPNGTNVLFADGSVRFIVSGLAPRVLHAILTYAGSEVVSANEISP